MFDIYWNYIAAAPLPAFAKMPKDPAAELLALRMRIEQSRQEITGTPYAAAVGKRVSDYIDGTEGDFTWAPYLLAYDSPDKSQKKLADTAASIRTPLGESLSKAKDEILIASPYFVPRKNGIEQFVEIQQRGVDVTIVTNSLAANNHTSVHGGYAHSRKPLLRKGIKIYEVRGDAAVSGSEITSSDDSGRATLHTKAFIVDRRHLFIGSFNFDPRSLYINTELGVIIDSAELAKPMVDRFFELVPTQAYEVVLNEKDQLRWRGLENGQEVTYDIEPQTSWWTRFVASFMTILPIKGQL
jgi:putative cardiolipin synthase